MRVKDMERGETAPEATPQAEAAAADRELEESLLAELRAVRASRRIIQGWVQRLTQEQGRAVSPRPFRRRCGTATRRG